MSTVIKIENLSKQYRLGLVSTKTLSHDLSRWYQMNVRGKDDPNLKVVDVGMGAREQGIQYIWALRDINIELQKGEVLGIIGKNGAGKSTLFKILSKITSPTIGTVSIKGRIASLLEVGTGFHEELTGRENIFLNGAVLGMTKSEIKRKFDEIVDFSGVERYIDTPVKRYSSGMMVRLGFAVAAHLEPEILIVDEVLAVGDAEFQKNAIGKMQNISKSEGRTVLFVSHNMAAVENLCCKTIILEYGHILNMGNTKDMINIYINNNYNLLKKPLDERSDRKGNQQLIFIDVRYFIEHNIEVNSFCSGDNAIIRITFNKFTKNKLINCRISLAITKDAIPYIVLSSELVVENKIDIWGESGYIDFKIDKLPLSKGIYSLTLFIEANNEILDWIEDASSLQIEDGNFYGTGKSFPSGWNGKTVLTKHSISVFQ